MSKDRKAVFSFCMVMWIHSTLYFLWIKITEWREFLSRCCLSADYFFPARIRRKNLSIGFINSWPLLAITHVIYVTNVPSSKELPGEGKVEKGNISSEVSHLSWTISAELPREGIMELWKNKTFVIPSVRDEAEFSDGPKVLSFFFPFLFAPFTKHRWKLDSLNCFGNLLPCTAVGPVNQSLLHSVCCNLNGYVMIRDWTAHLRHR